MPIGPAGSEARRLLVDGGKRVITALEGCRGCHLGRKEISGQSGSNIYPLRLELHIPLEEMGIGQERSWLKKQLVADHKGKRTIRCTGELMENPADSPALRAVNWIMDKAIAGVPPLTSAENLAQEYLIDHSYPDDEERIESLINWETTKNFTTGFITGLGSILTLPVSVPAAFGSSWLVQARMSAAIARIAGYDLNSDRVRTFIIACLVGDAMKDIMKSVGIKTGTGLTKSFLSKVPGKALIEINKKVGFRLVTKAGEKGAINLMKGVPVVGGVVGGAFDAAACRIVGKNAKRLFYARDATTRIRDKQSSVQGNRVR